MFTKLLLLKVWSRENSIDIIWEFIINAEPQVLHETYWIKISGIGPWDLCVNNLSRWFWDMLKFEKHGFRALDQQHQFSPLSLLEI